MSFFIPSRVPSSDFPSDILKWMKANAKPKMALKLMKCHKYFQHFPEFPYFVAKSVHSYDDKWYITNLNDQPQILHGLEGIENITKKFWITENIYFFKPSNLTSFFIPKIAVCDIKELSLEYQEISFGEFQFLTDSGNITTLYLSKTIIIFENGDQVFVEDILKCVPNVVEFTCYYNLSSILSPNFINRFKEINASKIKNISIDLFSYSCFEAFNHFVNHNPHVKYHLYLAHISEEEIQAIRNYIKDMIEIGVTKFPPLYIGFPGQTSEESTDLLFLQDRFNELNNIE